MKSILFYTGLLAGTFWACGGFATDLEEVAKVEMMPKLDGKKMNMMLAPKTNKK